MSSAGTFTNIPTPYCPKPNRIQPCHCGGKAKCYWMVTGRRCKRVVVGPKVFCWQHEERAGQILSELRPPQSVFDDIVAEGVEMMMAKLRENNDRPRGTR